MKRVRARLIRGGLLVLPAALIAALGVTAQAREPKRPVKPPNVLFIAVDDLNHWVGYMGRNKQVITPNIDRLAARGVRFTHAYCAAPVCNPSRAALMSGLRPATTGVYDNPTDWRPQIPAELTLPTHFRKHGYWVAGAGKIYHESYARRSEWDEYQERPGRDPLPTTAERGVGGIQFAPLDCKDEDLQDYRITNWVIDELGKPHDKPFFLACGLHKPHMPWNVPRKWYDLYPLHKVQLPPTRKDDLDDVPPAGVRMAGLQGDHRRVTEAVRWREAVRGYLAAISYTDMNVGRLIDALDRSPYRENTMVVLWGDHGWHLGEKQHWRKFALWEEATRAPLVWVAPGVTRPGGVCERAVDFMSFYPTLSELCGMPVPKHVQGVSIRRLLADPTAAWDHPAQTTYGFQNHAIRTDGWRYIRYRDGGEELYDEMNDPLEWTNLASRPEQAGRKKELARFFPVVNKPAPPPSRGMPEDDSE